MQSYTISRGKSIAEADSQLSKEEPYAVQEELRTEKNAQRKGSESGEQAQQAGKVSSSLGIAQASFGYALARSSILKEGEF